MNHTGQFSPQLRLQTTKPGCSPAASGVVKDQVGDLGSSQPEVSQEGCNLFERKLYQHRPQTAKNNFCVINAKNNVTSAKVQGSFSGCFFWMPLLCRVPWAPRNGTVVTPAPNYNGTLQWHHVHSQSWSSPSPPTIAHYNGTLQWHHVHSPKVGHPPPPPIAHYNGTLQWHPAMAPRPLPQSWSSPSPPMAPCNGTTSTPPKLVVTLPQP